MNNRTCIRYQGRIVTRRWLKLYAGKTPEDLRLRAELRQMPQRVPSDSPETFDRVATLMWLATLDDETLADAWRYARQRRSSPNDRNEPRRT